MFFSFVLLSVMSFTAHSQLVNGEVERYQIVIVGAGVSGFTAAATLLEHNVTGIILLEASDRIGGRIHTVEFGGISVDKGAEYCHGEKDNEVYELVHSYDLLTSYNNYSLPEKTLYVNPSGSEFNSTFVNGLMEKAKSILNEEDVKHYNRSLADYFFPRLEEMVKSEKLDDQLSESIYHLAPLLAGVYSGSGYKDSMGAVGSTKSVKNEGDFSLIWKSGGYNQIFDFLSKKFPRSDDELPVFNKTLFNKRVTRIEKKVGEVEVSCADGSAYLADHVIVTVSIGVLKKHAVDIFHPALPECKSSAIEALGMGSVGKVFMLFPYKWLPENIKAIIPLFSKAELANFQKNSEHGFWTSYTSGVYPVIQNERMMCWRFSGDSCRTMESLSDKQVTEGLLEILNKLVGEKFEIPTPEGIVKTGWANNPYTLGAFSYYTVESDRLNITRNDLAQPIVFGTKPVILFAGEATHPDFPSTVHGAIRTGRREANRLLDFLKK